MRGYVKIWTDALSDSWFVGLSGSERGMWLQLLLIAKQGGDSGSVWGRSWVGLGSVTGFDGKTARKFLRKFHDNEKVVLTVHPEGSIEVQIVKYNYWQSLRQPRQPSDKSGKIPQSKEKPEKIPPNHIRSDHTISDQSRSEQIKADQVSTLSGKDSPDNLSQNEIPYNLIIEDLNDKTGANYISTTPKTRKLISARWKEGFRLDDFKIVHIKKTGEWMGTDMAKYLRPVTLYGNKFEGYLNQIPDDNRFSETTKHNIQVLSEWLQEKEEKDYEQK